MLSLNSSRFCVRSLGRARHFIQIISFVRKAKQSKEKKKAKVEVPTIVSSQENKVSVRCIPSQWYPCSHIISVQVWICQLAIGNFLSSDPRLRYRQQWVLRCCWCWLLLIHNTEPFQLFRHSRNWILSQIQLILTWVAGYRPRPSGRGNGNSHSQHFIQESGMPRQ